MVDDAHIAARGCFRRLDDDTWTTALPLRHHDGWRGEFSPKPTLGADNDYVFGDLLGLDDRRRLELVAMGVIR